MKYNVIKFYQLIILLAFLTNTAKGAEVSMVSAIQTQGLIVNRDLGSAALPVLPMVNHRMLLLERLTKDRWIYKAPLLFFIILFLGLGIYKYQHQSQLIHFLQAELKERDDCLEIADERQNWLIKEIHHRVKNNLQIIISLLNTQASFLDNKEAIKAIQSSQQRMFAISLIHQKLYHTDHLSSVDMVAYTHELLEYLTDEFDAGSITYHVEMTPLNLDIAQAVPFGLILHEAISNTLKFAFPQNTGAISVFLYKKELNHYLLQIADNGIGLSGDKDFTESDSFGKRLIAGLAGQLGGKYQLKEGQGVKIEVDFFTTTTEMSA